MPNLSSFLLTLKGGTGSGNHGHSGRPGKKGGSSSKGGSLPTNPTSLEYSNYRLWENLDIKVSKPVYFRLDQLPPVPEGHKRIYHGTKLDNLESIDQSGLLPGKDVDKKERLDTILGSTQKPGGFGSVSVVVDLPHDKFHHVNEDWVEFNKIDPSLIKGYYVSKVERTIDELIPIYQDYQKLYGK